MNLKQLYKNVEFKNCAEVTEVNRSDLEICNK